MIDVGLIGLFLRFHTRSGIFGGTGLKIILDIAG